MKFPEKSPSVSQTKMNIAPNIKLGLTTAPFFCPISGCARGHGTHPRGFSSFVTIKNCLETHLREGDKVPAHFLEFLELKRCSCGALVKVSHLRSHSGKCPSKQSVPIPAPESSPSAPENSASPQIQLHVPALKEVVNRHVNLDSSSVSVMECYPCEERRRNI
jgi:hypothetical protein